MANAERPFKSWTSDSSLISHYGVTHDPEALREMELRRDERGDPGAKITPEFVAAVKADEAARPFAPAVN